jgi:phosphoribosylanthranilate isomerase
VQKVQPDGVDVSSGVELADGFGKDPEKIRAFTANARTNRVFLADEDI